MSKKFTDEDAALLAELGAEAEKKATAVYTPREERIIAGFEEIQRFVADHGRLPQHGEDQDVFERIYAVRLDQILASEECLKLLQGFDTDGILIGGKPRNGPDDASGVSDEALLAELGVGTKDRTDITALKHVRPMADRKAPEEVARRERCNDFEEYKSIFESVQAGLQHGHLRTTPYKENPDAEADIKRGDVFIVSGQKALVVEVGDPFDTEYERVNRRLRVVYDNGTESRLLLRSLQRSLYKDENSRRVLPLGQDAPTLFGDVSGEGDAEVGHIYIARSMSDHPFINEHRDVIHKIGVTGGDVNRRIANAKKDPTFLFAEARIVATYRLANVNRSRLERILHHFFATARLSVQLPDRFGERVEPREWFVVPLPVIRQAVDLVISEAIEHCQYDSEQAAIVDVRTGMLVSATVG